MISPLPYIQSVRFDRSDLDASKTDKYPFSIPVIANLERLDFKNNVTIIIGENGSGKSTLIEGIARGLGFSPEGGNLNYNIQTSDQDVIVLHNYLKYARSFARPKDHYFLRAESFYNLATFIDEEGSTRDFDDKSLHWRSHGEAFMAILQKKLRGKGLYIFDEPEAALSPQRQLSALAIMHELVKDDSQIIMATHSPIFMAYPGATLLSIDDGQLVEITFEETDHYKIYDLFFKNHQGLLHNLLQ